MALPDDPTAPLNPRQERAVLALLTQGSLKEAAKAAKVSYSALKGWMKVPAFRAALKEARLEALGAAVALVQGGAAEAVGVLKQALKARDVKTRIKAADSFLRYLTHLTEFADIAELHERLEELEAQSKAKRT